ncbi:MAG: response regulator, partial [Isosphaeraceae bacterium]
MQARHSILLVDDERDHCLNLSDILGDEDYAVDIAHDGPAAMKLIAGKDYDATLLDLVMPGIDGLALLRDIRGRRPGLPACFIT